MGSKKKSKWLLGCGIGCGVLVLIAIALAGIGVAYFGQASKGIDEAIAIRKQLEAELGAQADYQPPADGAVPPGRIETFLAVRETLGEACGELQQTVGRIQELDGREDVSPREVFGVLGNFWKLPAGISHFFQARNRALLDHRMGLGEYSYLFIVAYRSLPAAAPVELEKPDGRSRGRFDGNDRKLFLGYLRAQLAAAHDSTPPDEEMVRRIEAEIEAMEGDERRIPWEDGLPPAVAALLEPYRQRLTELACRAAEDFELSRTRRDGMTITSD